MISATVFGLYFSTSNSFFSFRTHIRFREVFRMGIPFATAYLYFHDSVMGRPSLHVAPAYNSVVGSMDTA